MNILFIFGTGSEVRQFLHSGVIATLAKNNTIFISSKVDISEEIQKHAVTCTLLPYYVPSLSSGILSRITKVLDIAFEQKFNLKPWKYNNKKKAEDSSWVKVLAKIAAREPFWTILLLIEQYLQSFKFQKDWQGILKENKINKVVVNLARNFIGALYTARYVKIPVDLLYHTNKDVFAQGRVNFKFNQIGVWNQKMEDDLLRFNKLLDKQSFYKIGNTHFSYLTSNDLIYNKSQFEQVFDINPDKDIVILYTTTGPGVMANEIQYIYDIQDCLRELGITNYMILVRTNPMDFTEQWNIDSHQDKLKIHKPSWYYDPKVFFNYTYKEDLQEFINQLYYASLCINIPSTVTIETSIMKVPTINLCYKAEGVECSKAITSFWDAEFNYEVRETNVTFPAFSKSELLTALKKIIIDKENRQQQQAEFIKKVLTYPIEELKQKAVDLIQN